MGDRHDFRVVNDFARHTGWLHAFMADWAVYGIAVFAVVLLGGWWGARRVGDSRGLAGLIWAPVAAIIALVINQPIVHSVAESRPFTVMPHTLTLIHHAADPGFPSDHATASGALAVGILLAHRKWGIAALFMAVLVAFSRVYVGVHYPVDVLAGLVLGGLVAGFGYFLAVPLLERAVLAIERSRIRTLVIREGMVSLERRKAVPGHGDERPAP